MNQPNHHQIATYLTNYVLSELVKYVMEDTGCGIEQAMEKVYTSPLMEALQDEENELYVQSPAYLYELMKGRWQSLRGIATAPEDFDYKQELASRYEL